MPSFYINMGDQDRGRNSTIPPHRQTVFSPERRSKYITKMRIAKGIMLFLSFFAFGAALYGTIYLKEAIDQTVFMACAVGLLFAPVAIVTLGLACWDLCTTVNDISKRFHPDRGAGSLIVKIVGCVLIWGVIFGTGVGLHFLFAAREKVWRNTPGMEHDLMMAQIDKSSQDFWMFALGVVPTGALVLYGVFAGTAMAITACIKRRRSYRSYV